MKKFLVVYGEAHEFVEGNPNIEPLASANAIERCKPDGTDFFDTPLEQGEVRPPIPDDGSDHYYRVTSARNFTIHEVNDLLQAFWSTGPSP